MTPFEKIPPNTNFAPIADIARSCIRDMHNAEMTYEDISQKLKKYGDVSVASLKTFVNRPSPGRLNTNNKTLKNIYNYLHEEYHSLPESAQARLVENWIIFNPGYISDEHTDHRQQARLTKSLGHLFSSWLHVSGADVMRILPKLTGKYYMLRKSVKNIDYIVKSELTINSHKSERNLLTVKHVHLDRLGAPRTSEGFIVPVRDNIYFIMEVERGEAIELVAIRNPMQEHPIRMMGFLMSINMDRKIISARVFIEKASGKWKDFGWRLKVSDLPKNSPYEEDLLLLDEETCRTLPDQTRESIIYEDKLNK